MTYAEQLKHPKWQKRRLEIMSRDCFRCARCNAGHITLNVHHLRYRRGAAPWAYEDDELVTLCEDCHTAEHKGELHLQHVRKLDAAWRRAHPSEAALFDAEKARQLAALLTHATAA